MNFGKFSLLPFLIYKTHLREFHANIGVGQNLPDNASVL